MTEGQSNCGRGVYLRENCGSEELWKRKEWKLWEMEDCGRYM